MRFARDENVPTAEHVVFSRARTKGRPPPRRPVIYSTRRSGNVQLFGYSERVVESAIDPPAGL